MVCKCRTKVFDCTDIKPLKNDIKTLYSKAFYYFIIIDNNSVYLERASLIDGKTEDIKKEKDLLIRELSEIKEKHENFKIYI